MHERKGNWVCYRETRFNYTVKRRYIIEVCVNERTGERTTEFIEWLDG